MADGPSRGPEGSIIKDTIPVTPCAPGTFHRNGNVPSLEPEQGSTVDPGAGQAIEQHFMTSARRSAAIIAAKNSGIENPTEADIRRVSAEMEQRSRGVNIPKPEDNKPQ